MCITNRSSHSTGCDLVDVPAIAVATVARGDATANTVSDTHPLTSVRQLFKLPALILRPSFALLSGGRGQAAGVGEWSWPAESSKASAGVFGVLNPIGEGLPILGDMRPVRGFAKRAVR